MLDGDQRVIGIARVEVPGSEHGWYWTTDFGSEVEPTSYTPGEARTSRGKYLRRGRRSGQLSKPGTPTRRVTRTAR